MIPTYHLHTLEDGTLLDGSVAFGDLVVENYEQYGYLPERKGRFKIVKSYESDTSINTQPTVKMNTIRPVTKIQKQL